MIGERTAGRAVSTEVSFEQGAMAECPSCGAPMRDVARRTSRDGDTVWLECTRPSCTTTRTFVIGRRQRFSIEGGMSRDALRTSRFAGAAADGPVCPRCGQPLRAEWVNREQGAVYTWYRCRAEDCRGVLLSKSLVPQEAAQGKVAASV